MNCRLRLWFVLPLLLLPTLGQGQDDLMVLEGGEEVRILDVVRERLATHHVLLLDTSESMEQGDRLKPMLEAARKYIEWLLPENRQPAAEFAHDLISIAGFDDDLILYAPPTPLRADIDGSAYYDSVLKLVNRTRNLTVFPIGLGLSGLAQASTYSVPGEHKAFLKDLALASGGTFFDRGKKGGNLVKAFDRIRLHLKRELKLSYVARPFGGGTNDRRDLEDENTIVRKIKIEPREPGSMKNCVVSGYKPLRYVIRPERLSVPPLPRASEESEATNRSPNTVELAMRDIQRDADPLWYYDTGTDQYLPGINPGRPDEPPAEGRSCDTRRSSPARSTFSCPLTENGRGSA